MFIVGEAIIDDEVREATFCCDLGVCKGACCCIEGGRGAPLEDTELREITAAFPVVSSYLRDASIATLQVAGLYEGAPGDFATPCVEGRECAYVYFDKGIARCSFERAHQEGKIAWRKPLSCHLFPIRIRRFSEDFVRYEKIEECEGGRDYGEAEQIRLHVFLKDPLIRKYGRAWYETLDNHCRRA